MALVEEGIEGRSGQPAAEPPVRPRFEVSGIQVHRWQHRGCVGATTHRGAGWRTTALPFRPPDALVEESPEQRGPSTSRELTRPASKDCGAPVNQPLERSPPALRRSSSSLLESGLHHRGLRKPGAKCRLARPISSLPARWRNRRRAWSGGPISGAVAGSIRVVRSTRAEPLTGNWNPVNLSSLPYPLTTFRRGSVMGGDP